MTQTLDAEVLTEEDLDRLIDHEDLWAVVVWNDDVNTFAHVIKALVEILHHSLARAEVLTNRIHHTGKAVVALRPKEEAVGIAQRFHARGIQATVEP